MRSRIVFSIIIAGMLVLTGCARTTVDDQIANQLATLLAQATPFSLLDTPAPTPTPLEVLESTPTPTPVPPATLKITSIIESAPGRAIVYWDAIGDFPSGYRLVWTTTEKNPTYPEDTSSYNSDALSRSGMLSGSVGSIYFVRVCRVLNDTCDVYSDLGIFAFKLPGKTATATLSSAQVHATSTAYYYSGGGGGVVKTATSVAEETFEILSISGGVDGKALMTWESDTSPADGFRIYFSKTHTSPKFEVDSYYAISRGKTRSAYVDGDPGAKYYYRLCKFTGTKCGEYTPTYAFTFPGKAFTPTPDPAIINISTITDLTTGKVTVSWTTSSGTFPNGFKVLYSKTDNTPDLNDQVVAYNGGSPYSTEVSASPDTLYYFRVCKFFDGDCAAYSPMVTFTLAPAPAPTADGSTITNVALVDKNPGKATISWDASGVFPSGFKIVYSTTDIDPEYPASPGIQMGGAVRSATVSGIPNTIYYYRVCKWTGTACTIYSDAVEFTYGDLPTDPEFVLSLDYLTSTIIGLTWTLPVNNDGGYTILYESLEAPIYPEDEQGFIPDKRARATTLTGLLPDTTYYVRLCLFNGTICKAYSNQLDLHTLLVD